MAVKKLRTDLTIRAGELLLLPMTEEHARSMRHWGRHASALYREYNYCEMTPQEMTEWFMERNNRSNRYFSILKDGIVTGFIGLKEIAPIRKRSILGFAVDKNKEGTGIAGAAMRAFLPVYFADMGFSSMDLFVYAYNERAIRLYRKLGFHMVDTTMDLLRNPTNFPSEEEMQTHTDAFFQVKGGVYAKVYQMRLRAQDVRRIE